jgi:hypothetical protein
MKLTYDVLTKRWTTPDGRPCVQLQAIGLVPAKLVRDFQPGEYMGWNFGSASKVERIEPVGASMCDVYSVAHAAPRRMKLDRLVAVASAKWRVTDDRGNPFCPTCDGAGANGEHCIECNPDAPQRFATYDRAARSAARTRQGAEARER